MGNFYYIWVILNLSMNSSHSKDLGIFFILFCFGLLCFVFHFFCLLFAGLFIVVVCSSCCSSSVRITSSINLFFCKLSPTFCSSKTGNFLLYFFVICSKCLNYVLLFINLPYFGLFDCPFFSSHINIFQLSSIAQ